MVALTIQRISNVHFNPETIGCQLNTGRKIAKTRLTRGIPTTRIPAIYSTMADKGDVGNAKSIAGNQDINAAPPPIATAIAAKSKATNTIPKTNSTGLQMIATITRQIFRNQPTIINNVSPVLCIEVRGLSDFI